MLVELTIQNLVIVEQAVMTPGAGLVVVSGETGAGKSLLLDALDLLRGSRAQAELVGRWGDATVVVGVFEVDPDRAQRLEAACGLAGASDGQIVIRRKIHRSGRSQAWINDLPVSVGALKSAAELLIAYHAQHEPIRLAQPEVQLELLDRYAGHLDVQAAYRELHESVLVLQREQSALDGIGRAGMREADYLRFQLEEFTGLAPVRGELGELERTYSLLSSAGTWQTLAEEAVARLVDDEQSVAITLGRLARRLGEAPDPRFQDAATALRQAVDVVQDAAGSCGRALDGLRADPAELARISERLDAYHALMRKHGEGEDGLFQAFESLKERLAVLDGSAERRVELERKIAEAVAQRAARGAELAARRTKGFVRLAKEVHGHLADLGMPKARLTLTEAALTEPTACGTVAQEFLVCTNPGTAPGSIREVASGGEAARLMLALAATLAKVDPVPIMIFDEVDSGVGGRLGSVIGAKLAALGIGRTVLAVTHTPQLAAAATRQYLVRKDQGEHATTVTVNQIAGAAREHEIADMLGGGSAALSQARAMLAGVAS
jgi:DNA repair protein RecN (Recombination protein N)